MRKTNRLRQCLEHRTHTSHGFLASSRLRFMEKKASTSKFYPANILYIVISNVHEAFRCHNLKQLTFLKFLFLNEFRFYLYYMMNLNCGLWTTEVPRKYCSVFKAGRDYVQKTRRQTRCNYIKLNFTKYITNIQIVLILAKGMTH